MRISQDVYGGNAPCNVSVLAIYTGPSR